MFQAGETHRRHRGTSEEVWGTRNGGTVSRTETRLSDRKSSADCKHHAPINRLLRRLCSLSLSKASPANTSMGLVPSGHLLAWNKEEKTTFEKAGSIRLEFNQFLEKYSRSSAERKKWTENKQLCEFVSTNKFTSTLSTSHCLAANAPQRLKKQTAAVTLMSLRATYFSIPSSTISRTWKSNRRPEEEGESARLGLLGVTSKTSIRYTEKNWRVKRDLCCSSSEGSGNSNSPNMRLLGLFLL